MAVKNAIDLKHPCHIFYQSSCEYIKFDLRKVHVNYKYAININEVVLIAFKFPLSLAKR